ncbi:unnamed protein product [Lupinus luteus]|uniref:Uncharacterized protein n=1 Tax=Lupinus luteus TaxID=3873 RepID=A0AAV1YIR2_LUPLU
MNEEELPKQQPREELSKQPQKKVTNSGKNMEKQDVDIVINLEIDRSTNINLEAEKQDWIQNNQTEDFEVLNQVTTSNALAAHESRLVGRLWADEEANDVDLEVENEITEETTYTKVLSKSQKKKQRQKHNHERIHFTRRGEPHPFIYHHPSTTDEGHHRVFPKISNKRIP